MNDNAKMMTVRQLAEHLGVSRSDVLRWIDHGYFLAYRRLFRLSVYKSDVDEFVYEFPTLVQHARSRRELHERAN